MNVRVAINAQLIPGGEWGGVEQFVIGLIYGLGALADGVEEYIIVAPRGNSEWISPYLGRNQRIVFAPPPRLETAKRSLGPLRQTAGRVLRKARHLMSGTPASAPPESNGFYESLDVHVVHFPFQMFSYTTVPYIYNPHDLQHLHYPEFFKPEDITARESSWPRACRFAAAVATDARWVKEDVVARYAIEPHKVYSILMGAPTEAYGPVDESSVEVIKRKFDLPETFAFYPAQTWWHKNHLRLLEAVARLRDRDGIAINLVCTGRQNEHWRIIDSRLREFGLQKQIRFLGFVGPRELRVLYRLAQFVIHPSLFEGGGLPVLEAFLEGTPVACSNVTSLPEYAGDAALYFDPASVESIAEATKQMAENGALRARLREHGTARVRLFTWERTAKMYRALYRKVAGLVLSEEDKSLLAIAQ